MEKRAKFISFESGEGGGKSTNIALLEKQLVGLGFKVFRFREPGGDPIAEAGRKVLLDRNHKGMDPITELLWYNGTRRQCVVNILRPASIEYDYILVDRFYHSTLAYQGHGRGLPLDMVKTIIDYVVEGFHPDVTYLFDVSPEIGIPRARSVEVTRFEEEDIAFHHRVRNGYLTLAEEDPDHFWVIDASQDPDTVFAALWSDFCKRFQIQTA